MTKWQRQLVAVVAAVNDTFGNVFQDIPTIDNIWLMKEITGYANEKDDYSEERDPSRMNSLPVRLVDDREDRDNNDCVDNKYDHNVGFGSADLYNVEELLN